MYSIIIISDHRYSDALLIINRVLKWKSNGNPFLVPKYADLIGSGTSLIGFSIKPYTWDH